VGKRLHAEVLGGADRAKYGDQLIKRVGDQLAQEFGRGFEAKNLRRMAQFAQVFAEPEIVATLSRQLSWSHFVNLLPLKTEPARQFYASQAASQAWSVRELRHQIERKAFERTELASLQAPTTNQSHADPAEPVEALDSTPAQVFEDPDFLDFLDLRQGHDVADLEAAILLQLETFILALGRGFAFLERQKRMVIDGEDFYRDLRIAHRHLHRLVATELKLGRSKPRTKARWSCPWDGWTNTSVKRVKKPPSASSSAPNPTPNKWNCCKCTKTASRWPNTGPTCRPRRSWNSTCTRL
jgi:predicted nuclease of restriction endonuclease-like (RecB) superfamily